jgi:hypothetical protein
LSASAKQAVNYIFANYVLELIARNRGRIEECTPVFAPFEQTLLVQPIERGHQRGVSNALFESKIDVAHAHFAPFPGFVEHRALQLTQGERHHFVGTPKAAEKKSRWSHDQLFCLE